MARMTEEMEGQMTQGEKRPFWRSAGRGLRKRCPNCGEAALFRSYLKQVDACPVCSEPWKEIRADDGPAWATILVLGHVLVPLYAYMAAERALPLWGTFAILGGLTAVLALALLPFMKGLFIAIIWALRAGEPDPDSQ